MLIHLQKKKPHWDIYKFEIYMKNTNGKMDLDSGEESVVDYYETQNEQFFVISWREQVTFL